MIETTLYTSGAPASIGAEHTAAVAMSYPTIDIRGNA